ncbi:MAG TPA: glycosyltransferase, partial [Myxococcaceae bacterium]|nr:glycosyltransferase [Myxococcaceae bacterium]
CGTPVITSNAASIPEVAGQAATLVPPTDSLRFAEEIRRVLDDPALRTALRAAGLIQASRFSWRTMADRTVRTYEMAVAER